jgi:hypothetical protein
MLSIKVSLIYELLVGSGQQGHLAGVLDSGCQLALVPSAAASALSGDDFHVVVDEFTESTGVLVIDF